MEILCFVGVGGIVSRRLVGKAKTSGFAVAFGVNSKPRKGIADPRGGLFWVIFGFWFGARSFVFMGPVGWFLQILRFFGFGEGKSKPLTADERRFARMGRPGFGGSAGVVLRWPGWVWGAAVVFGVGIRWSDLNLARRAGKSGCAERGKWL